LRGSPVFPPNSKLDTPAPPSANVELTRTVADGSSIYGSPDETLDCTEPLVG